MVGMEEDPASYWVSATFFSGATCQIDDMFLLIGGNSNIFWNVHPENWGR